MENDNREDGIVGHWRPDIAGFLRELRGRAPLGYEVAIAATSEQIEAWREYGVFGARPGPYRNNTYYYYDLYGDWCGWFEGQAVFRIHRPVATGCSWITVFLQTAHDSSTCLLRNGDYVAFADHSNDRRLCHYLTRVDEDSLSPSEISLWPALITTFSSALADDQELIATELSPNPALFSLPEISGAPPPPLLRWDGADWRSLAAQYPVNRAFGGGSESIFRRNYDQIFYPCVRFHAEEPAEEPFESSPELETFLASLPIQK